MTDRLETLPTESRAAAGVAYGLFLLGLTHGVTILIALIIAYANRGAAGPKMRSHYTFIIRTFWLSIGWFLVGASLIIWGGIFSLILIGLPFFALGWLICAGVWFWMLARLILGVVRLANDEAYPRPYAWII